jgi:uncharacterized protein with PQ loop repeat
MDVVVVVVTVVVVAVLVFIVVKQMHKFIQSLDFSLVEKIIIQVDVVAFLLSSQCTGYRVRYMYSDSAWCMRMLRDSYDCASMLPYPTQFFTTKTQVQAIR